MFNIMIRNILVAVKTSDVDAIFRIAGICRGPAAKEGL